MLHYMGRVGYEVPSSCVMPLEERDRAWSVGAMTVGDPSDADPVNDQWLAVQSRVESCSQVPADMATEFTNDFSNWTAWCNTYDASNFLVKAGMRPALDAWQEAVNTWGARITQVCGSADLPPNYPAGPAGAVVNTANLSHWAGGAVSETESLLKWVMLGALVLAVGWVALPALVMRVR